MTQHPDGKCRCTWCGTDPLYVHYHDTDWGVPEYDSRALFEKLILDGFQAGLSWITILRKRDEFRRAFDGFQPEIIAGYGPDKVESLMQNTGIVRNRLKISSTIHSARVWLDMCERGEDFSSYLWSYVDGKPIQHSFESHAQLPAQDAISLRLSKDLKKRGFNFCGPTIIYAFMQAVGMVNDHVVTCHRHNEVRMMPLRCLARPPAPEARLLPQTMPKYRDSQ
jgi:DNA-3-methyladenine glycosylase I